MFSEYPLSAGQRALWFLQRLHPASAAYNIAAAARLRGEVDPAALRRAFERLVERHEALRTSFHDTAAGPVQRVHPSVSLDFLAADAHASRLSEEAWRPFDLELPPLLRVRLFRTPEGYLLLLVVHHLAADLGSLAVIVRELGPLYAGERLPEPARYTDFVIEEQSRLQGAAGESLWAYWKKRLSGELPATELPADRPRPAVPTTRGGSRTLRLGRTEPLRQLARDHRTTLFATLAAGLQVLLHRYSGQTDILLGAPTSGHTSGRAGYLVGYLVHMVVLRSDLSGSPTFSTFLAQLRETVNGALRHRELPFPVLVERLQPDRDPSRPPIFQAMLTYQRTFRGAGDLGAFAMGIGGGQIHTGALSFESIPLEKRFRQLDLDLMAAETGSSLDLSLTFDADLFEPATAERILGHLGVLLDAASADPARPLGDLPLLTPAERHQLAEWNQTSSPLPDTCFHQLFTEQAARTPEALAAVHGSDRLTYADLETRANRLAVTLLHRGATSEEPIAVRMERGLGLLVSILGIFKAGCAYLPLNPSHPESHLQKRLQTSGARFVLTGDFPLQPDRPAVLPPVAPDSLAYILFTSGSTGEPKGAMVPHRALLNHLLAKIHDLGLTAADRVAQTAAQSFDISIWQFLAPLLAGATVEILPDETTRDPDLLLEAVAHRGITILEAVPSFLALLLEAGGGGVARGPARASRSGASTPSPPSPPSRRDSEAVPGETGEPRREGAPLRWLISTGESLAPDLARRCLAAWPGTRLLNAYGPTECADRVSHAPLLAAPDTPTTPIGRPIRNLRLHLLDRNLHPLPVLAPGQIFIAGTGVGRGYLADPSRTAEAFLPDPSGAGGRLYRTGDLGRRRPDGNLEVLGRADHQLKIRGIRVEPGEIEAEIAKHPAVREAVVLLRGDRLVAYWTGTSPADLRDHLRHRLPDALVPAVFHHLDVLPLTAHGKVDRRALPEPLRDSPPPTAPGDDLEELLAGILAEVLGRERVGARDHFFDLGGHSLLAAQVASRVRSSLGVEVPLATLFEEPTAAGLAARVRSLRQTDGGLPPLRRYPREASTPLSFGQERLWFLHQLDPESPAYNMPGAADLQGALDPAALAASLSAVAARHESLRTRFPVSAGAPRQEIASPAPVPLPLLDLSALPGPARERHLASLESEEARRPFDLARDPLLRPLLLRLGPEEHRLLVTMHHIVSDGWSQEILIRETAALRAGAALPELPVQYADFALWQREWLEGETLAGQLDWWRRELAGDVPPLDLPVDHPRPPRRTLRGARLPLRFPFETARGLRKLAGEAGATPFLALLALYQTLLHRLSGQDEIRVGAPVANRRRVEVEGLIGFFVNTLVLRGRFDERTDLSALLGQVRASALGAYTHQDVPFERIVDELQPERDPSRTPLFQAMLAFQTGEAARAREIDNGTAKFELTLSLRESSDGLAGWIEYDRDLFEAATAARIAGSFATLLEAGLAEPRRPVSELPLLTAAQRRQILSEWNDTRAPLPEASLHGLFEAQAARTPDAVAVLFGEEEVTYRDLDRWASRLASRLREIGARPEVAVGLCTERSVEMVAGLLGILKSGAFYVPLDPSYPRERLAWMLEDSGAPLILTQPHLVETLPETGARAVILEPGGGESGPGLPVSPESLAYTIFTSGSTGRPKGVQVSHRAVVNFLRSMAVRPGLSARDTLLSVTTLSFDIAALEIFLPLATGARVALVGRETASDGARLAAEMERCGATAMQATPATWRLLLEAGWQGSPGLKALCGGEALPRELAQRLLERAASVWNLYGPTETTIWSAAEPVRASDRTVPVGLPIDNTRLHVVDRSFEPVPLGVPGELVIGGAGLARGYRGRPDLTAERFVPDPFGPDGERLYRSGDLARRLADGRIELLGRLDQQVKVRGFRIELKEIEAALAAHPAVARAVVALRNIAGDPRLVAWLVPAAAPDAAPDPNALRGFLGRTLPGFMIPSHFLALDSLPLTPNGKVDRRALPAPDLAGAGEAEAPAGPVEETVAAIWSRVLGIAEAGRHQSFFELGGHSLLATRVMARINETFRVDLPLRALFEAPTVAGLARAVSEARRGDRPAPAFERIPKGEPLALSFAQERLWVMERLAPESPVYNLFQALRVTGPLDAGLLERCLAGVLRRHEALRTTFTTVQGRPFQVVAPAGGFALPRVDLRGLDGTFRDVEAARLARAEARRPFDLQRGPLFRTLLARLDEQAWLLTIAIHHIVCDDASIGLLVREAAALYRHASLPELAFQYADYAEWQRRSLSGPALEAEIGHWKEKLQGELPVLELPADRPRPPVQTFRGALVPVAIPGPLAEAVRELGRRQGATPFMALLAAFAATLHQASGQDDLILGTPVAGRTRVETEGMIGFFVNVLPLRIDLSGSPTWEDLLARVRETALEAYDHQDLPFEKLVEALQPKRDLGRAAIRQAGFAFQDTAQGAIDLPGGVAALPVPVDPGVSRLDLTLFLWPSEQGFSGFCEHSTDLFDRGTIVRLLDGFRRALEEMVEGLARPIPAPLPALAAELRLETNLTEGQLLFWFARKLNPDVQLYFERATVTFTLDGEPDAAAFESAFQALVDTCDVLRTRVAEVQGVPWRTVSEPAPVRLERIDLPEAELESWLDRRCAEPMDPAARLYDSALLRLGRGRTVWFFSAHHLIADAWTLQILARRLSDLYALARRGELAQAPRFRSYEEYVATERETRRSERYLKARAYWEEKLARRAAANPFYRRAGAVSTTRTGRLSAGLAPQTSAAARGLTSRLGVFSPSVVFAGALLALLHRLNGERRQRIGTPVANRPDRFRETPGLMMNAVPLEMEIEPAESFASLARKLQREFVEVSRHQVHPVRNPVEDRAWEVYFNFQIMSFRELCGLPARFDLLHSGHSQDHLGLQVSDFGASGSYRLDFDFNLACFDAAERRRTLGHALTLLDAFLEDPERALADAPLLSPGERGQLVGAFNDTAAAYPRGVTLHALIEAQIERTPDAIAVAAADDDDHGEDGGALTYRELGERSGRLAARLQARGVGPDSRVGVSLERSLDLMVALVGVLRAGGAYVPVDPGYPAERVAWILEDSRVAALLSAREDLAAGPEGELRAEADEGHLAYAIYTSGSTGRPKGVMVPHAGICNRLFWMQEAFGLTPADRVLQKTPIGFDVSVWELFWPLMTGARLVMARPGGHQDPAYLVSTIAREGITTVHFVPSLLQVFLEQPGVERCTSLRRVICSGEALPDPLRRRFHERLPRTELHNLYGPTEASVDVTAWRSDPADPDPVVPIGRPIANIRAHVLGPRLEPLPLGIAGELLLGGIGLARGYLGRPDLTAERFVPDPFGAPGDRLYRTGDLARWRPDGNLEYLGRTDHQVKIRGFRIELGEIEAALAGLPGVREAAVTLREDRPGDRRLVAYYVGDAGVSADPLHSELRQGLRATLPEAMVPSAFVPLDAMPLTPSGKVDRRALPAPSEVESPLPGAGRGSERGPRTPLELLIASVWAEVLGVESVPVEASFFDLGGNSLLATQVVTLLQDALPVEIDLRQVFEGPTVARLAALIEAGESAMGERERETMALILSEFEQGLTAL